MTTPDETGSQKSRRAEEAANIVRRLDENPEDPQVLADKQAFLARGDAERRTYAIAERALAAATKGIRATDRGRKFAFAIFGAMLASLYLAWEPMSVAFLADHRSTLRTATAELKSGDVMILDASSAMRDNTDEQVRSVTLMRGAGFFDVDTDGRRFVVKAHDVTVEAIGTAFEVMRLDSAVRVSVAEGVVEVRQDGRAIELMAGEQLLMTRDRVDGRQIEVDDVARWRSEELTLTGLTLGQAAAVIERRVPGRVVIMDEALRNVEMGGVLNLSVPQNALATLAAAGNADVLRASRFLTFIRAR